MWKATGGRRKERTSFTCSMKKWKRFGRFTCMCLITKSNTLLEDEAPCFALRALSQNPRREVVRIMKYLDLSLSDKIIDEIVELTSFKKMKENPMANYSCIPKPVFDCSISTFMRKGVNYCKPALCDILQETFKKIISNLYIFAFEYVLNNSLSMLLMTYSFKVLHSFC